MRIVAGLYLTLCVLLPSIGNRQTATNADQFETLRQRAEEARSNGRLSEAIDLYQRALQLQPSWIEGHWSLGTSAYEARKYQTCRTAFGTLTKLDVSNGPARAFKGLCEFELKAFKAALTDLNEGQRLGLGEDARFLAVVRYHRAILLTRFGEFDRAIRAFAAFARGGNQTDPVIEGMGIAGLRLATLPNELPQPKRASVVLAGRALVAAAINASSDAEAAFAELMTKYPDERNVHYLYGLYLQPEDPAKAEQQFQEELRRSPQHALATLRLAQAADARGDFETANRLAVDAVRLAPHNFVAHRVLGETRLRKGDIRGAIASLETAMELQPDSPSVRFQLAKAYGRAGRTDDAIRERAEFTRLERQLRIERGGANAVGDAVDEP